MKLPRIIHRISHIAATGSLVIGMQVNPVLAEPVYHPSGPTLTFGGMTQRRQTVSDMGNPAQPAVSPFSTEGDTPARYGVGLGLGLGIEYDGNDNFFKLLDRLGGDDALAPGDGGDSGGGEEPGKPGPIIPPGSLDPEIEAAIAELAREAAIIAGVLLTATTGLNAKAFVSADIPLLISNKALGGSWTFNANNSVITNLRGLHEPIEFDADAALAALKAKSTAPGTYDLTGGLSLTINPDGSTTFKFENNSGVITRAAHIREYSIGYSRRIWQKEDNRLYIGIKPKLFDVGLSNTVIPVADINKAKDIFDSLDGSSFEYSQEFSADLGLVWTGKQFQVGVTATNLNEPEFHYPAADLSGFTNQFIINAIRDSERYTMERQLKLEGGFITQSGAWGINFGYDVNAVPDPMNDDYQWLSIGAGYASDSWWLPGARVGARKNLAGSQLTYITAGLTLFNIVNLDLATTTETIEVDGTTVPRGFIGNISAQIVF